MGSSLLTASWVKRASIPTSCRKMGSRTDAPWKEPTAETTIETTITIMAVPIITIRAAAAATYLVRHLHPIPHLPQTQIRIQPQMQTTQHLQITPPKTRTRTIMVQETIIGTTEIEAAEETIIEIARMLRIIVMEVRAIMLREAQIIRTITTLPSRIQIIIVTPITIVANAVVRVTAPATPTPNRSPRASATKSSSEVSTTL